MVISTSSSTFADVAAMKPALLVTETSMVIVLGSVSVAPEGLFAIRTNPVGLLSMMVMVCVDASSDHPFGKSGAARVTVMLP
ncbi:MAG: hypothetical protein OXF24_00740, partial [Hyphomicrobiales bacterium]|nr:hypothetical protein [Hyphomicrobiales bacterium]